jgi:hypothetical protein
VKIAARLLPPSSRISSIQKVYSQVDQNIHVSAEIPVMENRHRLQRKESMALETSMTKRYV